MDKHLNVSAQKLKKYAHTVKLILIAAVSPPFTALSGDEIGSDQRWLRSDSIVFAI